MSVSTLLVLTAVQQCTAAVVSLMLSYRFVSSELVSLWDEESARRTGLLLGGLYVDRYVFVFCYDRMLLLHNGEL